MKTYHLPCGIKFGALNEYYGNFDSYCPSHRSKREVKPMKSKAKNYVLTDLGLVPEHVDREAGFDSEKYKDMLRKIEKQYGEKKKEGAKKGVEVKQENDADGRKKRETSDEETRPRPGPKSRTIHLKKKIADEEDEERSSGKKKKEVSEEREGVRRGGRERKTFGSDIYKSAKEELEAMLKKKELVNLSDTFTNLAGTRRATKSIYNKGVGEEEEEDTSKRSKKGRSSRGAMGEVDDEDDEEDFRSKRRETVSFARDRRPARKSPECDSEEEENKSFKKIMKKKKSKLVNESQSEGEETTRRDSPRSKIKKESSESEEERPRRSRKSKKVLTPEPEESNPGEWSVKVKISEPLDSEQEEEPRRKPGPKSRMRPLTPQQKEPSEENLKRSVRKGKPSQENGRKEGSSDEDNRLATPQPNMSDSEEEDETRKKKDCESIESIQEFLVGGRLLERKGSTESNSDSGNRKQKIRLTKVKKPTVDSGDEEIGTPPENEFEDAEPDTIQETLAQNDGFVDTSGILSANGSDEGADIEKPNFNDDEDEDFDFSDIITKLDVQIEDEPSWHDLDHCYRFKCKVCDFGNRDEEKLEEHVKTVHNKKMPRKMVRKQEMVVSIERQRLTAEDRKMAEAMVAAMSACKIKEKGSTPIPKNGKKKKMEKAIDEPELTGERYPFFKYANDEVTIAMIDRGNSCIKARDKTPESHGNRTSLDNIDSLLDDEDSPEKETKSAITHRRTSKKGKVNLEKVEESESATDCPKEDEEGVRRGGRVRKTLQSTEVYKSAKEELALKKKEVAEMSSDREDEATEETKRKSSTRKTTSGKDFVLWENDEKSSSRRSSRSSRPTASNGDEGKETSSKKDTWKIDYISTASSREGSPSANDSTAERKEEERGKRSRRKSPPKKIPGSSEAKSEEGRDCLTPVQSEAVIEGPVFECMKCGTRLKQRKDLVMNHLKLHKLNFESYIGNY